MFYSCCYKQAQSLSKTFRSSVPLHIILLTLFAFIFYSSHLIAAPTATTEIKKLLASDGAVDDWFGDIVIGDGDTIVVGAFRDDDFGDNSGSVYIYERNQGGPENWGEVKKLTAFDGEPIDKYGFALDIEGDTIVVGSHLDDDGFFNAGSVYIYGRDVGGNNNWGLVKKIVANDAQESDLYGISVDLDGDTLVIGADLDDDIALNAGSVYIHERNQGGTDNWGQTAKITAADSGPDDHFGIFVALDGDTLVVSARDNDNFGPNSGVAYIFGRNEGAGWGQIKKLIPFDGAEDDRFGIAVAIEGDLIAVGAHKNNVRGDNSGAAYLFGRNQGGTNNWGLMKKIHSRDSSNWDLFGNSIAISGDSIVVSAFLEDNGRPWGTEGDSGAIYVFSRNSGGQNQWGEAAKYIASDGIKNTRMGRKIAILGNLILGGSRHESQNGSNAGAVYLFEMPEARLFLNEKKIMIYDPTGWGSNIWSIDVSGDRMVLGSPWDNQLTQTPGLPDGAIYVMERNQGGPDNWGMVKKVFSSDSYTPNDWFGWSVAVEGDIFAGGSIQSDYRNIGATFVHELDAGGAGNWGQVRKFTANELSINLQARFGFSMAMSGDWFVAGTQYCKNDPPFQSGCAYLQKRNNDGSWSHIKKLTASDWMRKDFFGQKLDIDGENLIIGSPGRDNARFYGRAYIFNQNHGGTDNWGEIKILPAPAAADGGNFGNAVAIHGNTAIVGAFGKNDLGSETGAAYIFERHLGGTDNWGLAKTLYASDPSPVDKFGFSVAIEGDNVLVGAPWKDSNGRADSGAMYHFQRNMGGTDNWGEVRKIVPSDPEAGANFGYHTEIENNLLFSLAEADMEQLYGRGAVYVYTFQHAQSVVLAHNQWKQISLPCDPGENNSVNAIFGDDIPGTFGTNWAVWGYDTTSNSYVRPELTDSLTIGTGYWIIQLSGSPVTIDAPISCTTPAVTTSSQCSDTNGCFASTTGTVPDGVQWNMVGFPFSAGVVSLNNLRVSANSGACSDANACTLDEALAAEVLYNSVWRYNGSAFDELSGAAQLNPWDGFWTPTLQSANGLNPQLLIPLR